MNLKVYTDFNEELKLIWNDLEESSDSSPFQSFNWLSNWHKIVGVPVHKIDLHVICVFTDDKIISILPMSIRKIRGVKVLEWLGGMHTDYLAPILKRGLDLTEDDFGDVWNQVLKELPGFDIIHFSHQPSFIGTQANPFSVFLDTKLMMNSYQCYFEGSWEDYKNNNISKKVLADSRRQRNRLSEIGKLEFKIFDEDEDIHELTETMIRQKRMRYDATGGWDQFQIPEHQELYRNLKKPLGKDNTVHCSALLLDNKIIASHWGIISKSTLFYILPTHEGGDLSKYSAGKLLLENLLEWCCDNDIKYFDFTGGEEPYKKIWTNTSFALTETVKPNSFKGNVYIFIEHSRSFLKDIPIIGQVIKNIYNYFRSN
jgi:CelD/BcsL family acetyltransferase involved in cellulose biosynthesis